MTLPTRFSLRKRQNFFLCVRVECVRGRGIACLGERRASTKKKHGPAQELSGPCLCRAGVF
jgi:hypothetical protein